MRQFTLFEVNERLPIPFMYAISLWQPWASLVEFGAKLFETRSWSTKYRGRIAIHAAKRPVQDAWREEYHVHFRVLAPYYKQLPLGCIVATATLVNVCPVEVVRPHLKERELLFGDYSDGRYAWQLGDIERLAKPIPCRGMQGLWKVNLARLLEQAENENSSSMRSPEAAEPHA